jgi:hypothetical protein
LCLARAENGEITEHTDGYDWQEIRNARPEELRVEQARLAELYAATEGELSPSPVKEKIRNAAAQELRAEEERLADLYVETDDEPLTHAAASEKMEEEGDSFGVSIVLYMTYIDLYRLRR